MITKNSNGSTLSADFIAGLTADNRSWTAALLDNGVALDGDILDLTISKGSVGSEDGFTIGSVVGSALTATIRGLTTQVKGKEIEARIGLYVNGAYEYITLGYFTIAEAPQTAYTTTITGYGKVVTRTADAFNVPATPTLANIAASIASSMTTAAGTNVTVAFDNGIDTTKTITASLNNLTVYQALMILASVCGGYAVDTYDGNVKICRFDDTPTLSRSTSTMLTLPVTEEADFSIAGVLCIVTEASEDEDGTVIPAVTYPATPTGNENLVLYNPYMTQGLYTDNLASLTGYEYRPGTADLTYGDPRLEANDVLSLTDIDANVYVLPCHMITHTFTGGFSTQVIAVNATPQENDVASSATSLTEQLSNISSNVIATRIAADTAKALTDEIQTYADTAGKTVTQILNDGETAGTAAAQAQIDAASAKASAENASEYAARALGNLSTVQSVTETLTYITQHGTMTLTTDTALNPTHVYFVVDAGGDYTVNGTTYAIVTEPDVADIATYYELTIDESLQNYVGTHLALTTEGLWLLPAASGYDKVLIATGAGSTYTTAGTYIIDANDNTVACFGATATIGISDGTQSYSIQDYHSLQLIDKEGTPYFHVSDLRDASGYATMTVTRTYPLSMTTVDVGLAVRSADTTTATVNGSAVAVSSVSGSSVTLASAAPAHSEIKVTFQTNSTNAKAFTIGTRGAGDVGAFSYVEGRGNVADGVYSHAEGRGTTASADHTHAEGSETGATGAYAHAEGYQSQASGYTAHAQNYGTIAQRQAQTTLGKFNVADAAGGGQDVTGKYAVIIGNGTSDNARSNALTVNWNGGIMSQEMAGVIQMYAGSTAPSGWLICDGSAVSRTTYATLFAVIGTTYGTGDGSTTFNLPDLRGRFPLGVGNGTATGHTKHALASKNGNENLIVPYHTHTQEAHSHNTYYTTANRGSGSTSTRVGPYGSNYTAIVTNSATPTINAPSGTTSGNTTGANMPPYITLNFIIATGITS